jgi:hypothetical protein
MITSPFGQVMRAAGWYAGDTGLIPGRDRASIWMYSLQRFESALAKILHYIKSSFLLLFKSHNARLLVTPR